MPTPTADLDAVFARCELAPVRPRKARRYERDARRVAWYELSRTDDPYLLAAVSAIRDEDSVRKQLADNPYTPPIVLDDLCIDAGGELDYRLVHNPSTATSTLERIGRRGHAHIFLASHPNTPAELLRELASRTNPVVRADVARNPATPVDVVVALLGDDDLGVVDAAAANPALDDATFDAQPVSVVARTGRFERRCRDDRRAGSVAATLVADGYTGSVAELFALAGAVADVDHDAGCR